MSRAVCLWEAESIEAVRDVVDGAPGDAVTNESFSVDAKDAVGLADVPA